MQSYKPDLFRATGVLVGCTALTLGWTAAVSAQSTDPHASQRMPPTTRKPPVQMRAPHRTAPQQRRSPADDHRDHAVPGPRPRAPGAHAGPAAGTTWTPVVEGGPKVLPPFPKDVPEWLYTRKRGHVFYKRGPYNFDIYKVPKLARDLNAVAVGHAMAYEDLVTGNADTLETKTFNRINRVLNNPPRFMPDEMNISPTFVRKYGVLELVFDWTHILHAQTVDVLASPDLTQEQKDREIEALWKYYFESVPWKVTPLPMNMGYLYGQPYSRAFRDRYPKVNGLFWGYHWLQGAMYDLLDGKSLEEQRTAYELMGRQYHEVELYRTDREFMPMFAELSPRFAQKFPHISNAFDNLHMLHDMVNDILASDWIPEEEKERQILRAVWMLSADAHPGEKPGDFERSNPLHDHRFMPGIPGMGMMPAGHGGHGGHGDHGGQAPAADPHAGHRRPAPGAAPRPAPARPAPARPAPARPAPARPAPATPAPTTPAPATDPHAGHRRSAPPAPTPNLPPKKGPAPRPGHQDHPGH